jgi:hypothetical protein
MAVSVPNSVFINYWHLYSIMTNTELSKQDTFVHEGSSPLECYAMLTGKN